MVYDALKSIDRGEQSFSRNILGRDVAGHHGGHGDGLSD